MQRKELKTLRNKSAFTLLEIVLCIAILGIAAVTVTWQIRNMVVNYSFEKNIGIFITDLKQMQFLALANQVDIEIIINKFEKDQKYYYKITCNDPNKIMKQSYQCLDYVEKIDYIEKNSSQTKPLNSQKLTIFRNGRISLQEILLFYPKNSSKKKRIDLTVLL